MICFIILSFYFIMKMNKTKRRAAKRTSRRQSLRHKHRGGVIKTKHYPDGSSLTGDFDAKNRLVGPGRMTYDNGEYYKGHFKGVLPHGEGRYVWPTGYTYTGNHTDGKMAGKGVLTYPDGAIYEGDFKDDKKNGVGKLTENNGCLYEGQFLHDHPHGQGKYTCPNGDVYEGQFQDGVRHGRGKLIKANGYVYEGEFKNNRVEGEGHLTFPDGRVYEGMVSETANGDLIGRDDMPHMEIISNPPRMTPAQAAADFAQYNIDVKRAQIADRVAIARASKGH